MYRSAAGQLVTRDTDYKTASVCLRPSLFHAMLRWHQPREGMDLIVISLTGKGGQCARAVTLKASRT